MLEEAKSDVLILLDCCAAASSIASVDSGITEVVAACGFETWTPGVGEHSFSRSLINELKFLSTGPLFTAAMLHNKVLSRIKYWKPRYNAGASLNPRDLWAEKRKTPVYILLAGEAKQRSIELTPLRQISSSPPGSAVVPASFPSSESSTSLPGSQSDPDSMEVDSSQSSLDSVWPDSQFNCPKVLITVALEEDQWLQTGSFSEWIGSIPALAKYIQVEGVYQSGSTLLIASMPVAIWDLLPQDPALRFLGFIRSRNLLFRFSPKDSVTTTVPIKFGTQNTPIHSQDELLHTQIFVMDVAVWMDSMDSKKHVRTGLRLCSSLRLINGSPVFQIRTSHSPSRALAFRCNYCLWCSHLHF
jgi:hypothetical protein